MTTFGRLLGSISAILAMSVPAVASEPVPHVTDIRGDANFVNTPYPHGGIVGNLEESILPNDPFGSGIVTEPASHGPADVLSLRFETTYEAVPVGDDGIDHRVTGVRLYLRTAEIPRADGPTMFYTVKAGFNTADGSAGCISTVETVLPGMETTSRDPRIRLWFGNQNDSCPEGIGGSVTHPDLKTTITSSPPGIVMEVPLSALDDRREFLDEGAVLVEPRAFVTGVWWVPQFDTSPKGDPWTVGSDVPVDVPCTAGCS